MEAPLAEMAQPPKAELGKAVKEVLRPTDVVHTEITGGRWDEVKRTYTIKEPDDSGVVTTYKIVNHPFLRGTGLIETQYMKDGKEVVPDEVIGQWRAAGVPDKLKRKIETWMTTGYVVQEKYGGQQTVPDGKVIMVDGIRHKLHLVRHNRPIVANV